MSRPEIKIPCIRLCDAAGKTIRTVIETWDYTVVAFTDGEVACLQSDSGDSGAEIRDVMDFPVDRLGRLELIDTGLVTVQQFADYDAALKEWNANEAARKEADERAEFERLQKKFGGAK